jgi:iron complex outermembrane receptor protein
MEGGMKKIFFVVTLIIVIGAGFVYADVDENGDVDLERIVVTPYRYEETLGNTISNVTVITQDDIKNSNAKNVVDILRPVSGITVRDYYGNGVTAAVDVSGFGEQGALNVLVLVDGRRINDVDLSGVDWSQVPLDNVERVEIIRGSSAGVLYGDNASSGVVNIITKKGAGKPKMKLQTEYGSYDMNKQKLSLEGAIDNKFLYFFNAGRDSTHGYRSSTFNKNSDFASNLEYKLEDMLSLRFNSGIHDSTYGMPSGLFQHHIDEHGRKWARYGEDHANNKDYYFAIGAKSEFSGAGSFDIDLSYRQKDTDSYFPTSNNDTRKNKIETLGMTPKYMLSSSIFDRENKFIAGVDCYRVFYNSDNYSPSNDADMQNYTNIRKDSIGSYLQDEFSVSDRLILVGGYRYEAVRYAFNYHDFVDGNPSRDSKLNPNMEAFNSGIVYNYKDDSNVFFNAGKSFRFPEVDEFTGMYDINFHQFLNTDLTPQSAMNYQIGLRHKFTDNFKSSLSLYRMKVRDYIYYNPAGGQWGFGENENYDKTIHEGAESSFEAKLNDRVNFFGNYTFTKAYFDGGQYDKKKIPMVPRHKGSVGLRFLLSESVTFNITDTYVGRRYFINDQANAVSPLNGYMIADTNLLWRCKDVTINLGVNNIFNKQYSEYGVYGTDSSNGFAYDKCYFPSPERNFEIGAVYKW